VAISSSTRSSSKPKCTREPQPSFYDELPQPFSEPSATEKIANSAAPLLAGFSFALIGIIVTNSGMLRWPDACLALLVVAVIFLINSVQAGSIANRWSLEPSQWRDLLSLARADQLAALHNAGPAALRKHKTWLIVTRMTYNAGVVALFTAVAFCLVPPGSLSAWRVVAIGLAGLGAGGQAVITAVMGIRATAWNRTIRQ
jgi:hypothetical protein